jgi:glucose-6-phosphate 1-epimerase
MHSTINLKNGACTAAISPYGGQLLSWQTSDGQERIYLSPRAVMDCTVAIRGGVPVCFPQFNMRVLGDHALPKHGFARLMDWQLVSQQSDSVRLELVSSEASRAMWPHEFVAGIVVTLERDAIKIQFDVTNRGQQALSFAIALHTYFQVSDIHQTVLMGLQGHDFWDAVKDAKQPQARRRETQDLHFGEETDRVYVNAPSQLWLKDGSHQLSIRQSESMPETVVWNPGMKLCQSMQDMPPEGWRHMLCVEAACIERPLVLAPGQSWQGWQAMALVSQR